MITILLDSTVDCNAEFSHNSCKSLILKLRSLFSQDIEFVQVLHLQSTVERQITVLVLIIITYHEAVDMVAGEIQEDIETLHLRMVEVG